MADSDSGLDRDRLGPGLGHRDTFDPGCQVYAIQNQNHFQADFKPHDLIVI